MSAWLRRLDGAELWAVALLTGFIFVASASPLLVSMAVSPEQIERGAVRLSPPCPIRARSGEGCPTCGLTRGFTSMSRLRLGDAYAYNPAAPGLYLALCVVALASGSVLVRVGVEAARLRSSSRSARSTSLREA